MRRSRRERAAQHHAGLRVCVRVLYPGHSRDDLAVTGERLPHEVEGISRSPDIRARPADREHASRDTGAAGLPDRTDVHGGPRRGQVLGRHFKRLGARTT